MFRVSFFSGRNGLLRLAERGDEISFHKSSKRKISNGKTNKIKHCRRTVKTSGELQIVNVTPLNGNACKSQLHFFSRYFFRFTKKLSCKCRNSGVELQFGRSTLTKTGTVTVSFSPRFLDRSLKKLLTTDRLLVSAGLLKWLVGGAKRYFSLDLIP